MTNIIKHSNGSALGTNPFAQMSAMRSEMDKLFDAFWGRPFGSLALSNSDWDKTLSTAFPRVDVRETNTEVIVTADVPGYNEDDLDIEVGDGYVRISGEHSEKSEEGKEDGDYYRMERSSGSFSRMIGIPNSVDSDRATADTERGVLTITLPKRAEEKKTKVKVNKK